MNDINIADPPVRPRNTVWIMRRRFALARAALFERSFYVPALAMAIVVWLIGCAEGLALSHGPDTLQFAWRYGLANILPSLVWGTKDADLVARVAGLDPATVLVSSDIGRGAVHVSWAFNLYCLRSLTGGFVFINYILRVAGIASEARQSYRDNVLAGREPPPPVRGTGRVIRLAGECSDVTEFSLTRDGERLFPVYEIPGLVTALVQRHGGGKLPVYWQVSSGEYGRAAMWEGLIIDDSWLFHSHSGRSVLLLEADATVSEQALALAKSGASDLDLEEMAQGFRALSLCARRNCVRADRITRILLADLQRNYTTGGGHRFSLREWIEWYHEADILVDARAPLLEALLGWLGQLPDAGCRVAFNTHNSTYYQNLKSLFADYGYEIIDPIGFSMEDNCPYLVYHRTTADTLHIVQALVTHHDVAPNYCCALLDRSEGLAGINQLSEEVGTRVPVICSAVVYDDLLREIRIRILSDESDAAIQTWLDSRLGRFVG